MAASRTQRASSRRRPAGRRAKPAAHRLQAAPGPRPAVQQPVVTLFRVCKPGWAVIVEKTPAGVGTRFVCPFCPQSHRVPGPVRGFQKVRRAKWINLRRVAE